MLYVSEIVGEDSKSLHDALGLEKDIVVRDTECGVTIKGPVGTFRDEFVLGLEFAESICILIVVFDKMSAIFHKYVLDARTETKVFGKTPPYSTLDCNGPSYQVYGDSLECLCLDFNDVDVAVNNSGVVESYSTNRDSWSMRSIGETLRTMCQVSGVNLLRYKCIEIYSMDWGSRVVIRLSQTDEAKVFYAKFLLLSGV